jgi:hypothetical protein
LNKSVYHLQTVDGSKDSTSTAQICIFARGVTSDFEVFEELVDLRSMQGQIKGSDFILQKHNLELSKLVGMACLL